MQDDIERRLEQLAGRGDARGADDVWDAARRGADGPGPRRLASTVVGLAAAVLAFSTLVAVVAITADHDSDDPTAVPPSTPTTGGPRVVVAQNASSLVLFDDCAAVLDELKAQALQRVGPYGLDGLGPYVFFESEEAGAFTRFGGDFSGLAPGAAVPKSRTNTQEEGVDEPDLVETDGRRLFDVRGGKLRVVDVETAELTATVPLSLVNVDGAVLVGDVLAVFANEPLNTVQRGETKVVLVDVASTPVVRERLTVDGVLVDVRAVDDQVHVVINSAPTIAFTYPTGGTLTEDAATEANKERIRSSTLGDWLPSRSVTDADGTVVAERAQLTECDQIRTPKTFAGFDQTSLVTLDLDDLAASRSASVQAASLLVYGSADSLYTATTEYQDFEAVSTGRPISYEPHTDIHRFVLGEEPTYAGSGRVQGFVRDQFGLSEHEGHLRVASSTFESGAKSRVTVLRVDRGQLVETGLVDGLGPNEDIEGVRFVGDLGYVVTFQRTDPLYVVDLRTPTAPRLAGELKIPGYSRYLHPVGDGLLLGVGMDGTEGGQLTGAATSLFDVSDPAAPKRVDLEAFGGNTAPKIDVDHHAFTWWPDTATGYIPLGVYAGGTRVEVVEVADGVLTQVGELVPAGVGAPAKANIDRVVIVGDRVLSVSPEGVQVSDRTTLAPIAWVSYG